MSIRSLVENKSTLDYKALTLSLIQEIGIHDSVNWDAVIPANVQQNLFGGEILRLFSDHENFANQKDIRTISLKKGETSQLLILFARLKDEKLSRSNIERITKKFIGGQAAERYVVWFLGNPDNTQFKVVLSGKEGKKIVLKTLPFGTEQPYYKTYDFILDEVHKKVSHLFVEPNELWKALWKSFDISVVNKKFYEDIKKVFEILINNISLSGSIRDAEERKQFAVRLIGRIIFCWFLKKKDIISKDILSSTAVNKFENFYLELLEKLFFDVFNTPQKDRIQNLPEEINNYPFLNGGLFEDQPGDYKSKLILPNDWFEDLFKNTLEKYNFTIDENTSSNAEIAIDPEMLGRIFENLLAEQNPETQESARKATGSYYTPREIVDYMVEQSLIEYLKSNVIDVIASEAKQSTTQSYSGLVSESLSQNIEDFIHTEELPEELKHYSDQILEKLNSVKVLDPACGSGAFPIGMLQKLIVLKNFFSRGVSTESGRGVYSLKLQTILNSIYGCDIQPMAVELSRLRCWLSLIIDEPVDKKKQNWGIEYLPNLDFKFVCVNTLIGLPKMVEDSLGTSADDFEKLKELRTEFFTASAKRKIIIEEEFKTLQQHIAEKQREWSTKNTEAVTMLINWNPFKVNETAWFDPFWMFGINNGFDVVIANPPYVTIGGKEDMAINKTLKEIYTKQFGSYEYKTNLFVLFIERSISIIHNKGHLTFILPRTLLDNYHMVKIRQLILHNSKVNFLIELKGDVFENAVIGGNLIIVIEHCPIKEILSKNLVHTAALNNMDFQNISFNFTKQINYLNSFQNRFFISSDITFQVIQKIEEGKILLSDICDIKNGVNTGNAAKILLSEKKINNNYRQILEGKDIGRYKIEWHGLWINYDHSLKQKIDFSELDTRQSKIDFSLRDENIFNDDKIIIRQTADKLIATFDSDKYVTRHSTHLIISRKKETSIKYILSLINSKLINYYYSFLVPEKGKVFAEVKIVNLEKLPFALIDLEIQISFIDMVDKILAIKKQNPLANTKHLEDQIDIMVYKLYNLTYEEVEIIDPEIEKIISKDEYKKYLL
jgi:hypothetical protein